MRGEKGERAPQKVVVRQPAMAQALPAAASPEPAPTLAADPLMERLIEAGVTRAVAGELAAEKPEECALQFDYLPQREAQDPAAGLVAAIREGLAPPKRWRAAQAKAQRARRAKQRREAEQVREETAAADGVGFDACWAGLTEAERGALTEKARAELFASRPLLARHYGATRRGWPRRCGRS